MPTKVLILGRLCGSNQPWKPRLKVVEVRNTFLSRKSSFYCIFEKKLISINFGEEQ